MKKLILLLLFVTTSLNAQSWTLEKRKEAKQISTALSLTNSIRLNSSLEPLYLSYELNGLALSRLDSIEQKGFYQPSLDSTGELYYNTSKEFDNYFYNAIIGLVIPGKKDFTYKQITCELCKEVGFASRNIDGINWTMLVFDTLY